MLLVLAVLLGLFFGVADSSAVARRVGNPFHRVLTRLVVGMHMLADKVDRVSTALFEIADDVDGQGVEIDLLGEGLADVRSDVGGAAEEIAALQARVEAMEDLITSTLSDCVRVESGAIEGIAGPHVIIEGCNLHVRNGLGNTETVNGRGNLIVGYAEQAFLHQDDDAPPQPRTGSHNVTIGRRHAFTSYGGFAGGIENDLLAPSSSVLAGAGNSVEAPASAIVAGRLNRTQGVVSAVVAGQQNRAIDDRAVVVGGDTGQASAQGAVVLGGYNTEAAASLSVVLGGNGVIATVIETIAP